MIYHVKNKIRNLSHKYGIIKNMYGHANKVKVFLGSHLLSDETFAKLHYKENTGKTLDIKNPTTFNEKLWWLKLNNRDSLLTICSDKYKVRDYVRQHGLGHILTKLYGVYNNADDIDFDKLPAKVFIKTNHGSGTNILWDKNNPFDIDKFRKRFNAALKRNYYWQSREWNYKNIEPRIIIEEALEDKENNYLEEYRFFCFDGMVKIVFGQIKSSLEDGSKNPNLRRNIYDKEFSLLDVKVSKDNFDPNLLPKPPNFEKMVEYAEILSQPFPHCRVDFYNTNGKIYFGEITFYHAGGCQNIEPPEWERKMGDWINLDSDRIKVNPD